MEVIPTGVYEMVNTQNASFTVGECETVEDDGTVTMKPMFYDAVSGKPVLDATRAANPIRGVRAKYLRPLPPASLARIKLDEIFEQKKIEIRQHDCFKVGTVVAVDGGLVIATIDSEGQQAQARPYSTRVLRPHTRYKRSKGFILV